MYNYPSSNQSTSEKDVVVDRTVRSVVRGLRLSGGSEPIDEWLSAKAPQPEPKTLQNMLWSGPIFAICLVIYYVWPLERDTLMQLVRGVGFFTGVVFGFNLGFLVSKCIHRRLTRR